MTYFKYGSEQLNYLKNRDSILGEAIDEIGLIQRPIETDVFSSLIRSIIGQQISTKAADTVRARFETLVGDITADNIDKLTIEEIQACGMSMRKASYIKGIAADALAGVVDFETLKEQSDIEVIKELTQLKGVGVWTVEMLLLHSLHRPNILSYNDLGIRRGIMRLYGLEELPKIEFEKYQKLYEPYGSTASLYIWEISKN